MEIWKIENNIRGSKLDLMSFLVLSIFVYACDCRPAQILEIYRYHITNEESSSHVCEEIDKYEVEKLNLKWYGHVSS